MYTLYQIIFYTLIWGVVAYLMNIYFSGGRFKGCKPNLYGQIAVVTGGNTGIGKQTVRSLAQQGCIVYFGSRDIKKNKQVQEQINKQIGKQLVKGFQLDLSDFKSIQNFSKQIPKKIKFLINNAGVMALPKKKLTKQGHQFQFGVNHIGHFYLTSLLWQNLNQSDFFRIVNLSSLSHVKVNGFMAAPKPNWQDPNFEKTPYNPNYAYSLSKFYNVLFTHSLSQMVNGKGIVTSVHPGVVRTQLTRYMLQQNWMKIAFKLFTPIYCIFTKNAKQGAQTTLHCLYSPVKQLKNGGYYADCKLANENPYATQENSNILWKLSQQQINKKWGEK